MNLSKNFLPKKIFKTLRDGVMSSYFPWYFNDGIIKAKDKYFQFTFSFIEKGKPVCWGDWYNIMVPVLEKIKHNKIIKVKSNLLTKTDNIIEHDFHIDQAKGTTGILYLNNCNGYTKFKNGKKIMSEENTYVEFDSSTPHAGSSCTDELRRVVINFNYQ